MYKPTEELYGGIFDSAIMRKNMSGSTDRRVKTYELELFHTDTGVSYVDQGRYPTRRGMLLCVKPGQIRHSQFPVRCSFIRLTPTGGENAEVEKLLASLPVCTYGEDPEETEELIGLFAKLNMRLIGSAPEPLDTLRVNAVFLEILYRIARLCHGHPAASSDKPINRVAREAYEYINEHYTADCSLRAIAAAVNVSPNYLHTVFSEQLRMTPFSYVTHKRIEQAKKLILGGEVSMLEIALSTGFCSQSHFNKVFKEQTGLTPMEYRKKLLERY